MLQFVTLCYAFSAILDMQPYIDSQNWKKSHVY